MNRAPARALRVIDTGIRTGRENVAFDQALIAAHADGRVPDSLRFLRFRPCALIGLHQILSHEVRLDFCRQHGIEVGRRITGGGGLYLDEGQMGWELVLDRRMFGSATLGEIAARLCEAAARGLRGLGVPAQFRPRNDIEVDGRKISGTGGFIDGATLFYQGTLLVEFDAARMIEVLKLPAEKLAKRDLDDARRRVITLREVLGRVPPFAEVHAALLAGFRELLGLQPQWGEVSAYEEALAQHLHESEFGTDAFVASLDAPETDDTRVSTTLTRRGGSLRADIRLEGPQRERLREVLITGDFFMTPPRALYDLEAALRGRLRSEAGAAVEAFFARAACDVIGLTPRDFRELIESALAQLSLEAAGHALRGHWRGPGPETAPTLVFLHDALGCARLWRDIPERLVAATGCGALVYDRWGSGDSAPLEPPYTQRYLCEEARAVLPAVLAQTRVRDAVLVGHSDGAAIALAYAGRHPERVRGVIALAPHLFREARTLRAIDAQIADFRDGDLRARLRRHHGAKTDALFARLVETWTSGAPGEGWGLEADVRRVRCPVLALQGEDDEFFSAAQLERLTALLPGRVQTLRIPQCGHIPQHQARKPVLAALTAFLRSLGAPADAVAPAAPETR
jgi:lipoate-protein ligase A